MNFKNKVDLYEASTMNGSILAKKAEHYTKVESQTSGQSEVHWNNLSNVPLSFTPVIHEHPRMSMTDNRTMKPNVTAKGFLSGYFTSLEGLTGAAGVDYQDVIVFNGYMDASAGLINALSFDKSSMSIKHYQADQGATSWGIAKTLAYTADITWANVGGKPTTLAGYGITDASLNTHTHTLGALSDVTITAPTAGQVVRWNGSQYVNSTIAAADIPDATVSVKGVVQLTDSRASTSILLAATANAVKVTYDLANAALPKAGGTMTGKITTPATGMSLRIGDDAEMGDVGIANQFGIQGVQDPLTGGLTFGSGKDTNIYRGGANLLKTDDSFQAVGSISSGGGLTVTTGEIRSDNPLGFLTLSGNAQHGRMGSVLASSTWADATKVPTNGIYSKGAITTDGIVTTPTVLATGPGESRFSNGTFVDPHAGTTYGAKISQGVSTDKLNLSGKVNILYNATESSLDFIFI